MPVGGGTISQGFAVHEIIRQGLEQFRNKLVERVGINGMSGAVSFESDSRDDEPPASLGIGGPGKQSLSLGLVAQCQLPHVYKRNQTRGVGGSKRNRVSDSRQLAHI